MRVGLEAFPFHLHLEILGVVAALVIGYVLGIRRLAPRYAPGTEPAVTRRQIAWFTSGMILFSLVELWPVHDIAEGSLFTFHMIEHLVLALAVPPMLLLGTPWWLLRLIVKPALPLLRWATKPLVALIAFNAVLALLHAPSVVDGMLGNALFHFAAHSALILSATLMWWPVIGPIPDLPKLSPPAAMGYLFLQSLVPTIPASFLTFASAPVYDAYVGLPRLWGLDVLNDQLIAGLIMKLGGGAVLWTAIAYIWFRWAAEEERSEPHRRQYVRSP